MSLPRSQSARRWIAPWLVCVACGAPPAEPPAPAALPPAESASGTFDCAYDRSVDADLDGYAGCVASTGCDCASLGWWAFDCDDADASVRPVVGADPWVPDPIDGLGIDNDCDGQSDEDERMAYPDADGDGFPRRQGGFPVQADATSAPGVIVTDDTTRWDCDDTRASFSPVADEVPADDQDSDCDGLELCWLDADQDGFGSDTLVAVGDLSCTQPGVSSDHDDCEDSNPWAHPGNEVGPAPEYLGDGVDNDCDGEADELECELGAYAALRSALVPVSVYLGVFDAQGQLLDLAVSVSGTVISPGTLEEHPGAWWWRDDASLGGVQPVVALEQELVGLIRVAFDGSATELRVQGVANPGKPWASRLAMADFWVWPDRDGGWPFDEQLALYSCNGSVAENVRDCVDDGVGTITCTLPPVLLPVHP